MEKWRYNKKLLVSQTGEKEFPFSERRIIFCSNCQSVYYKKSWHHNKGFSLKSGSSLVGKFKLCPTCQMIKNKEFEGQLTISNFPPALKKDLIRLIKNFCQRAFERDPLHRLIDIKDDSGNLMATTTENQLAVKLAKKIKEVFNKNKVQIKISYSPEPSDVVYIKINFVLPL